MTGSGPDRPVEGDAEGQGTAKSGSRCAAPVLGLANFSLTRLLPIGSKRNLIIKTLRLCRVGARRITVLAAVAPGLTLGKARNELNFVDQDMPVGSSRNVRPGN